MPSEYAGVLLMVGLALAGAAAVAAVSRWLRPGAAETEESRDEGELGRPRSPVGALEQPPEELRGRFAVRFHLVALLFVVLGVEVVFLLLWGVIFRDLGLPGLIALAGFVLPLFVGFVYEWAKGALEW